VHGTIVFVHYPIQQSLTKLTFTTECIATSQENVNILMLEEFTRTCPVHTVPVHSAASATPFENSLHKLTLYFINIAEDLCNITWQLWVVYQCASAWCHWSNQTGQCMHSCCCIFCVDKISNAISTQSWDGFQVVHDLPGRGRGVMTTRRFQQNEVVCDYNGELLSHKEGIILHFSQSYYGCKTCGFVFKISLVFWWECLSYFYTQTWLQWQWQAA